MILIIKILLLSWFTSYFVPLQWLLELIPWKMCKLISIAITSCWKCCSLWVGLILTGNIWISLGASVIASLLQVAKNKLLI